MQQTKFGKMYLDHDSVVEYSEDEIVEADRITLGYKKRLSMIENQMQHLLEDFTLDVQQIESILADLQKYYDAFLQLLQKRNKSLQCKRSTHQPVPSPMNSHTSTNAKVNLSGKLMKFQLNSVQKFDEENILRILQNKREFEHYFQIDKGKKQRCYYLPYINVSMGQHVCIKCLILRELYIIIVSELYWANKCPVLSGQCFCTM
ncbi:AVB_G0051200.mRNA.1.CDS.1 [Saccharomyces cerevisiae]|nr:CPG_1a_G0051910.mRNA.1.CDS.1 [Saccharomyces cerevisiae]CAI4795111.1 AIE_G0051540.mRNA.1.CDS.1 [Saccharomyces cerevisiae]CAI4798270.1 AVB_G0051200.mRNA.1.CDS.1 [Saccharomyces cerevisiae]CAI6889896.1 AIE_G0051540.mRNA.1.CDS.1 [Saccharomyces cerevisiae]CAI7349189.1 AVB_G0051200.mRNA.1.CDS.1 [Saccharomyces cerevisiae]